MQISVLGMNLVNVIALSPNALKLVSSAVFWYIIGWILGFFVDVTKRMIA